jgi:hypothetical protein
MTGGWSVLRRYGIAVIAVVLAVATMRLPEIGKGAGSIFLLVTDFGEVTRRPGSGRLC